MQQQMFSMKKLKDIALSKMPVDHALRTILLAERDYLTLDEFKAKVEIWLNLLEYKN